MRIFNFLLASDAVGGLGPPEGLTTQTSNEDWLMLILFIAGYILGIITVIIIKKTKSKKGDE